MSKPSKHFWQAARIRWLELRWGYSTYLTYAVAFTQLDILVSLRFNVTGSNFFFLTGLLFVGLSLLSVTIGNLHKRWQQNTDVTIANKALVDEIVRVFKVPSPETYEG